MDEAKKKELTEAYLAMRKSAAEISKESEEVELMLGDFIRSGEPAAMAIIMRSVKTLFTATRTLNERLSIIEEAFYSNLLDI